MIIKQISVFIENKQGRLAEITDVVMRIEEDLKAMEILKKAGYTGLSI